MMKHKSLLFGLFLVINLNACTWVDLTAEGEKVRVLNMDEVAKCQFIGQTTSNTAYKVAGVRRHDNAIQNELESLARNSAVNLGGDTIVAAGDMNEGKQTFQVYRCVPQ